MKRGRAAKETWKTRQTTNDNKIAVPQKAEHEIKTGDTLPVHRNPM